MQYRCISLQQAAILIYQIRLEQNGNLEASQTGSFYAEKLFIDDQIQGLMKILIVNKYLGRFYYEVKFVST